jgi:uncharacterized protein with ATP-grasp and redox domains
MKTYLDCYPCLLRQALDAARMAGADERQQEVVLNRVLDLLMRIEPTSTPPEIGDRVHRTVRQEVGDSDPYRVVKETNTREALTLYPHMKALLASADDPLETAVRLSIAGNIIDSGPAREYDLRDVVKRVLAQPLEIDDGAVLREALTRTHQVLYLADNAGETVFDRLLIDVLDVPVLYAVKGGPILNDATREDALAAGIDDVAEVVRSGSNAPGTVPALCSQEFRRLLGGAQLVIAKGQANYETLSENDGKFFFLLQAKCPVIARDVGVPVGSIVLKQGQPESHQTHNPDEGGST